MTKNDQEIESLRNEFKQFTYRVSHDLNSYSRSMIEFSKLLKEENSDDLSGDGKLYLSLIIESGEKLQKMMSTMLEYTRLDTMAKPLSEIDSEKTLKNVLTIHEEQIKKAKAKIEIHNLPKVKADFDQLLLLFMYLLDNSLKYLPAGEAAKIDISAQTKNSEVVFAWKDSGIGVSPEYLQRIFEPFSRLHNYEDYPGVGMGLTLAKKIINYHGGKIWAEPAAPNGLVVYFSFPTA